MAEVNLNSLRAPRRHSYGVFSSLSSNVSPTKKIESKTLMNKTVLVDMVIALRPVRSYTYLGSVRTRRC